MSQVAPSLTLGPSGRYPPRMTEATGSAVVTGAGRGIGRAIALELARAGYGVGLQARSEGQLLEVKAEVEALGGRAVVVLGDVTEPASAEALLAKTAEALGPVTVCVANAGQAFSEPLTKNDPDRVRRLFEVNTMSAFHLVGEAARVMGASGTRGRIVVVASTAAVAGQRYTSAYSASKHAVLGLVRSAALELAGRGITVNALCPGWVDTEMFDQTLQNIADKTGGTLEEARGRIEKMIPMREVVTPEEVAGYVRFLTTDAARHVTGQALVMDGGETLA